MENKNKIHLMINLGYKILISENEFSARNLKNVLFAIEYLEYEIGHYCGKLSTVNIVVEVNRIILYGKKKNKTRLS